MRTLPFSLLLLSTAMAQAAAAAAPDPTALANKADVLKDHLTGAAVTAVHEVTDTAGKTEKQVYQVLNQVSTGNSFIVISSESPEVNGTVYLIKGGVLYAAAPNQRSFMRLGSLNLDRRISGSLFSHWDLQGNIPIATEYTATLAKADAATSDLDFAAKPGSHYKKITAKIDNKSGLFTEMSLYDDKGLLKTVTYSQPKNMGTKVKRRVPTHIVMKRADGRSDVPVAQTTFIVSSVELDPDVDYGEQLAASDANLQKLRSKYVLSKEAFRSLLSEAQD